MNEQIHAPEPIHAPEHAPEHAPQSIYPYLKINKNDQKIYTKEYFQGLEIEILHANPIITISQKGGGELPVSGPYKYFNYFFNNIKTSKEPAEHPATIASSPPVATETQALLLNTKEHSIPPHEIFIFIKNTYIQPKQIEPIELDINDIEHLAKTLTIQIKIHEKNGRMFSKIQEQDILLINNQFVFFPQQKETTTGVQSSANALGNFLLELLNKSSFKLENTKLAYFIKRALEEKVILWI